MKIGFIADIHVGNHRRFGGPVVSGINTRCGLVLTSLQRAVQHAKNTVGCDVLVVLGDLFDTSRPEAQIIAEVQKALEPIPTILLLGNHEQVSTSAGDHALGPLDPVATLVERPEVIEMGSDTELWVVPFQPGNARDWLPGVLKKLSEGGKLGALRILCLHLGISDNDTAPWLKGAFDSIAAGELGLLCEHYGIQFAFAGNWHDRRQWVTMPSVITQVGALVPTGFDNPGVDGYGGLAILDTKTKNVVVETVAGPRFVKAKWRSGAPVFKENGQSQNWFVQLSAPLDDLEAARAYIANAVEKGALAGGEVVPDSVETTAAARSAATVARSAETLDEAVAGFIEAMVLPDDVSRASLTERVRNYLALGGDK